MLYGNVQQPIGNTPLVRLANSAFPDSIKVYAKLELWNPSGSVKDRMLGTEHKAEELRRTTSDAISLEQFRNQSNPLAHYETTRGKLIQELT